MTRWVPGRVQPDQLSARDVLVSALAAPVTLEAGARARSHPCLGCSRPIGSQPATVLTFIPAASASCTCGSNGAVSWWIHAACDLSDLDKWIARATARIIACANDGNHGP